jgi:hypothetical protein
VTWPELISSGRFELSGDPFLALRFASLFRPPVRLDPVQASSFLKRRPPLTDQAPTALGRGSFIWLSFCPPSGGLFCRVGLLGSSAVFLLSDA